MTDFAAGAAGDKLDISAILSGSLIGWDGDANPFGAGFLRVVQDGADTLLQVDRDGIGTGMAYVTLARLQNVDATTLTTENFTPGYPIIQAENHAPFNVTAFVPAGFIPETAEPGEIVGTLSATDVDAGDSLTFTLTGGDVELFEIVGNGIRLKPGVTLDFETATSHMIEVVATDSRGATSGITQITLQVSDVFESNVIDGTPGPDVLTGTPGDDTIFGYEGADTLSGGAGNDILDGGSGNNLLIGGEGDDTLIGGPALTGNEGNRADYSGATGPITVVTGAPTTVTGDASVGTDALYNVDSIVGTAFNDQFAATNVPSNQFGTFVEFEGGAGDDIVLGNNATRISYRSAAAGVTVDLAAGTGQSSAPEDVAGVGFDTFTGVNQVRGSGFDDTLLGSNTTAVTEVFRGLAGNDFIDGRGGQDRLDYNNSTSGVVVTLGENGVIGAGTAQDGFGTVDTFVNMEQVRGSQHADVLTGDNAANVFLAEAGNDVIDGGGGVDTVDYSGNRAAGIDVQLGAGLAQDGYGGTDTLTNVENITGSNFNDTISGDAGANTLRGQIGNDFVFGDGGNDSLFGGQGNDYLDGGAGDDVLDAGDGDDTLNGGTGFNTFNAGAGNDTLQGGTAIAGLDGNRADYSAATGPITVVTGATTTVTGGTSVGNDSLFNIDSIVGTSQADSFTATNVASNQFGTFVEFEGRGGDDSITGNGATRVSYRTASAGVTVDLAAGTGQSTAPADAARVGVDTFTGVNAVRGSGFDDTLLGSDTTTVTEAFRGQAGNDFIDGRGGQDRIEYSNSNIGVVVTLGQNGVIGAGSVLDGFGTTDTFVNIENIRGSQHNDMLTGDAANNVIQGEAGSDLIDGAGGIDTVDYNNHRAMGVVVDLAAGTADDGYGGTDTLINIENVSGSSLADIISGDAGANSLRGQNGQDILTGAGGDDQIIGGGDSDTAVFSGMRSDYDVLANPDGSLTITDRRGIDGSDRVSGVEQFQFADRTQTAAEVVLPVDNHLPGVSPNPIVTTLEDTDRVIALADLNFSDADPGDQLTHIWIQSLPSSGMLLRGGNPISQFEIFSRADIEAGQLVYRPAPDASGYGLAEFTYTVTDGHGYWGSNGTMRLDVTPVNDAPSGLGWTGGSAHVDENAASGTVVLTLTAFDPDSGDTPTLAITGGASDLFEVVGSELRVRAGASLDYEAATSHIIEITATDTLGAVSVPIPLSIDVVDVADTPQPPNGPDFVVNTTTSYYQDKPSLANLPDGRFVVVWYDSDEGGASGISQIQRRIFNSDGSPASLQDFRIDTIASGVQDQPSVVALDDGRFVVAWSLRIVEPSDPDFDRYQVRARILNADGTPDSDEFDVLSESVSDSPQPQIDALADGSFVATWTSWTDATAGAQQSEIVGRVFGADGSPTSSEFVVNSTTDNLQFMPTVAGLPDGRFVVAWADLSGTEPDTSNTQIRARVLNADGSSSPEADFIVNTHTIDAQTSPSVGALANGDFVVVWADRSGGAGFQIQGRVMHADGNAVTSQDFTINTGPAGDEMFPTVRGLADGRFIVAWTSFGSGESGEIHARLLNADGSAADSINGSNDFAINTTTANLQWDQALDVLSDGRIAIAWTDWSSPWSDSEGSQIRARILSLTDGNPDSPSDLTGELTEGSVLSDTGSLAFAELDHSAPASVSFLTTSVSWSGGALPPHQEAQLAAAFSINPAGYTGSGIAWTYDAYPSEAMLDFLADGETATLTFDVTATDSNGMSATETVTVTITGTNDGPQLSSASSIGQVVEDTMAFASGTLNYLDGDGRGEPVVTVEPRAISWTAGALDPEHEAAIIAAFQVHPYLGSEVSGHITWQYQQHPGTLDFLAQGEQIVAVFGITATDSAGATTTQDVTITITGTNDMPMITSGVQSGETEEDSGAALTGEITYTEFDVNDTVSAFPMMGMATWSGGYIDPGMAMALASALQIAAPMNGTIAWTYAPAEGALDFLAAGETLTVMQNVQIMDGHGGMMMQPITVTVQGTNDGPVFFPGGPADGSVLEGSATVLTYAGLLEFIDRDRNDTATISVELSSIAGAEVSPALESALQSALVASLAPPVGPPMPGMLLATNQHINWSFALGSALVAGLDEGETLTVAYDITVTDPQGESATRTVTMSITGTNSAAVLSADVVTMAETDAPLTATGQLTITDVDSPEEFAPQIDVAGTYGTFSIDSAGAWTFVANTAFDELPAGTNLSEVFNVFAVDGTPTTVTITITGTNDAPVVTAFEVSATEGAGIVSVDALAGVTDADAGAELTVVGVEALPAGVTLSGNVFSLDPSHSAFDGLAVGQTMTLAVAYGVSDGIVNVPNVVTFTITGTNDAPTAVAVAGGHVAENAPAGTLVATLSASDADGEEATFTLSGANTELFEVIGNEIRVASGAILDFETMSSYDLIVTATDPHGAAIAQPITLTIDNVTGLIVGGSGNDVLTGTSEEDNIYGAAGNDTLNGAGGPDHLYGGTGNDTFVVDASDTVIELAGEGTDTVQAGFSYALGANVENLVLTGGDDSSGTGNALNNTITGNGGANLIDGGAGADTMSGGTGDDTYVVDTAADRLIEATSSGTDTVRTALASYSLAATANVENIVYTGTGSFAGTGNSLSNTIEGGAAGDTLSGGAGADRLIGGAGDDSYVVDNVGDLAIELDGQGTDTVTSSVSFTLGADIENLTLTGTAPLAGTGNTLDNVITGGAGANTIDGGLGDDRMAGGADNDTYVVDSVGDVVIEAASQGTDTVRTGIDYVLGANIENLVLTGAENLSGTGNALANALTGNSGNNILDGGAGIDSMTGGLGDDTYRVDSTSDRVVEYANQGTDTVETALASYTLAALTSVENLSFTGTGNFSATGNGQANVLISGAGNDLLSGGAGADRMQGGAGDDIYVVDNAGDVVVEQDSEGSDTVRSAVSYSLGANVEALELTGGQSANATGNELDNTIVGNSGANNINGGLGADRMSGASGNDTYVVDNAGDVVTEEAGQGTDSISTSLAAFDLATTANVENLTFTGSGGFTGTGNTLANSISGGSGDDALSGGDGADTLRGNLGNDWMDGGTGGDTMLGGLGDDTYVVDSTSDRITELTSQGTDTVVSSINSVLGANLENLTLSGSAVTGTGNTLANVITGTANANTLDGGSGNDTVIGGGGADTLLGGAGNDRIVVTGAGFTRIDGGTGQDTLVLNGADAALLDLTAIANSIFSGLEAIDIRGDAGENNLLRMALSDVQSLSTNANSLLAASGFSGPMSNDSIIVYGDDGDLADLSEALGSFFVGAHWQYDGEVTIDTDTFAVMNYYDANGILLGTAAIDNDVNIV
ncbi:MAG: VCBS domain-containing protein [Hyphomicrobiaceae bacterium]